MENEEDFRGSQRRRPVSSERKDKLPPNSIEAEKGVLGCCLLSPNDSIPALLSRKANALEFFDLRHRSVFENLVEMWGTTAIDLITVQQWLKDRNILEGVGGIAYLSALQDAVPSAANLMYYYDIVREKNILREAIRVCSDVVERAYGEPGEFGEFVDHMEKSILQVAESNVEKSDQTMKEVVLKATAIIENKFANKGALTGVPSGYPDLDKMTCGFQNGEMIVIAARPSTGKTSLAMNIVEHAAVDHNIPVGVFSLEMTAESLGVRMLCSRARVNLRNINDGFLAEKDFTRLTNAAGKLANSPIHIDDSCGLDILQLRAKARRMWQQHGIKLFVIDYLQIMSGISGGRNQNRERDIADISMGTKALAKELGVPIIVLSQLNRDLEKDKHRKPRLADLRESGAIEQDADMVGILYKPSAGDEEEKEEHDAIPVNLLIAKQRNGPTGDVNLVFVKGHTRFESAAKVYGNDLPDNVTPMNQ